MMAQSLDPLGTDCSNSILCCYMNATSQIQVARISDVPNWYFERAGQTLLFESPPEAHLEIHTGMASVILADRIACQSLQVHEPE